MSTTLYSTSFLKSFIIFLCFSFHVNAQNVGSIQKDSLRDIGIALLTKGKQFTEESLDSSLYYKQQALPYFEKANDWEGYLDCINNLTYIYYYQHNYEQANKFAEKAFQIAHQKVKKTTKAYAQAINNHAGFLRQKGANDEAIKVFEQTLPILKNTKAASTVIADSYHNLGNIYRSKGDYDEAINYFNQALDLRLDTLGQNQIGVARIYLVLGNCYREKEEWLIAFEKYHTALTIINHPSITQGQRTRQVEISCYQNIANIYSKQGDLDQTQNFVYKAMLLQLGDKSFRKSRSYEILGKAFLDHQNYPKAIQHLEESKALSAIEYGAYKKHVVFAQRSNALAMALMAQGDYDRALVYFQQALEEISQQFSNADLHQNPVIDDFFSKTDALDILMGKAQALYQKYLLEKKEDIYLQSAYQTYQLAVNVIPFLRADFSAIGSKYHLAKKALPVYEKAIQLAIELHQKSGNEDYLQQAFVFAESNKSVILLESLKENMAKTFAGIPDSLLQLEKKLNLDISFFEKKISSAKRKNKTTNSTNIKQWKDSRFKAKENYKKLVQTFEKNYPKYYQLKHEHQAIKPNELQAKLDPQTLLIEYFVGHDQIYIFGISRDQIQIKSVANSAALLQEVEQVRAFISQSPQSANTQISRLAFMQQAHHLYQQLVNPVLGVASSSIEKLLVIPDDFLSYIPFDILLTQSPEEIEQQGRMEQAYLLQQKAISYHYSASLAFRPSAIQHHNNRKIFAGFAPSFQNEQLASQRLCTNDVLSNLSCNRSEVEAIETLLSGDAFLDEQTSKINFQNTIRDYQIIHLATHACVDDQNPMQSKIYFSNDHLSNYDLYNLEFNADLAVLSACNTGAGKLVKGEGVMSLARGFIHAGCPSVLMSLWSVDDCATSDIMLHFYQHLLAGKSKEKALQQAKIDYLQSADKLHVHPYYWSAFVQFGERKPLVLASRFNYAYLFFPLLGLLLFGWFVQVRKKN